MKKPLLLLCCFCMLIAPEIFSQCSITPNAGTFILSPSTVGASYTLNSNNTYPVSRAFYICQGTTVTIQNRPGADTFYVATGAGLIGFEANQFRVFMKSGSTYDATNSSTALIYYETGATITNYTGPMLPPCPSLTISTTNIPNACNSTGINENEFAADVLLYPNPAQKEIIVNVYFPASKYSFCIYDMLGKKRLEINSTGPSEKLDVSGFSAGIYFLRLCAGDKVIATKKIVKE